MSCCNNISRSTCWDDFHISMVTNVVGIVSYIGSIQLDHSHIYTAAGVKVWDFISYFSCNSIVL